MFYEGSEKRLEITSTLNLLDFEHGFWQEMVKQAGAYIISHIKNDQLKAFILSESSLFIWKNKLLLITCGETHLLQAALYFQRHVARDQIKSLLFQRHQANKPAQQKSSFEQDRLQLHQHLNGNSLHWHEDYQGDLFIFGNNKNAFSTKNIVMFHDLSGPFFDELQDGKITSTQVTRRLQLSDYFNDFLIADHRFEPKGYSVNAISESDYLTLHITPELQSSYLSFESNLDTDIILLFITKISAILNPQRAYLMKFKTIDNLLNIDIKTI
jgi:S-adenosylmethionine decarboxylase